tara:strand:- start:323 stop:646 length:324 start_codon:yes stop_codon:yes gene_type:complete
MSKPKYKIRYRDNMTTYLLDEDFNSIEQAEYYIECNLGESSLYEVETTNHNKMYEVKLIVKEEHFLKVKAADEEDAMEIAESIGVNSIDAHSTRVDAVSVVSLEEQN